MRAVALALLLVAPVLAGCLEVNPLEPAASVETGTIDLESVVVPSGAEIEEMAEGVRLTWTDLELPLTQDVTVPEGTTMVRTTAELADGGALYVQMVHAETGRRRCQIPYVKSWTEPTLDKMSCAGLTAVDTLPTEWTVRVVAPTFGWIPGESDPIIAKLVTVEFLTTPVDGIAGKLDLTQLSQMTHDVKEPQELWIESFDGTRLYAQLTLPEGEGPWPTVIASSPYNGGYHAAGEPAMWKYFTHDWAKRGYAILNADVRGFGNSGGCVEVWGENEQKDQAVLVDWVAEQDWSDGNVGFYGQSYVGTTPTAAAVQAPEALKAIIAVAPVINAYDDWHFGGVPNGESSLSPVAYQVLVDTPTFEREDPLQIVKNTAASLCDPTLIQRANDPRAIYDDFYEVRNFSARAKDVKAAVLYTQGFEDTNVKSAMITHWFNALESPKLGLFGHWVHQHPPRADHDVLFLGWMDQYVKGKPVGFDKVPAANVITNAGTHRTAESWPPVDAETRTLHADFADGGLSDEPGDGTVTLSMAPTGPTRSATSAGAAADVLLTRELDEPLHAAGTLGLRLKGTLAGAQNAHVAAFLYDGNTLVTWGMANLAHRAGHDRYEPVTPTETVTMTLPFLPTEYTFDAGDEMRLVIRGADVNDWALVNPTEPGRLTLEAGEDGVALLLPTLPAEAYASLPLSAST